MHLVFFGEVLHVPLFLLVTFKYTHLLIILLCIIFIPVVQLSPVQPAAHVHHPSVCLHVSGLQLDEHIWEQFVPKYPFIQARSRNIQI